MRVLEHCHVPAEHQCAVPLDFCHVTHFSCLRCGPLASAAAACSASSRAKVLRLPQHYGDRRGQMFSRVFVRAFCRFLRLWILRQKSSGTLVARFKGCCIGGLGMSTQCAFLKLPAPSCFHICMFFLVCIELKFISDCILAACFAPLSHPTPTSRLYSVPILILSLAPSMSSPAGCEICLFGCPFCPHLSHTP
jgi:hypothetical protein